jgi:hypothetical protein
VICPEVVVSTIAATERATRTGLAVHAELDTGSRRGYRPPASVGDISRQRVNKLRALVVRPLRFLANPQLSD